MENKPPSSLPTIIAGVAILGGVILLAVGIFAYRNLGDYFASRNTEAKPPQATPTVYTPPTQQPAPESTSNNVAPETASSDATPTPEPTPEPSPTIDEEKARQMGQQLKTALNEFLKDQSGKNIKASKDKAYYIDIDEDGKEDAAFLYSAYIVDGNSDMNGLVVFRNDGDKYNYVGHEVYGGKYDFHLDQIKIEGGRITLRGKSPGANDPSCCPTIPTTIVYVIKDNRLQKKR